MSDPSSPSADDAGGIGALSILLHDVTVSIKRAREAFRADAERQPRRGVAFGAVRRGNPEPARRPPATDLRQVRP